MMNINNSLHSSASHSPLQQLEKTPASQDSAAQNNGVGAEGDTVSLSAAGVALSQDPKAQQQDANANLSKALSAYRQFSAGR